MTLHFEEFNVCEWWDWFMILDILCIQTYQQHHCKLSQFRGGFSLISCFFVFQGSLSSCDFTSSWLWFLGSCDVTSNSWLASSKVAYESTFEFSSSISFLSLSLKTRYVEKIVHNFCIFASCFVSINNKCYTILCVQVNSIISIIFSSYRSTLRMWIVVTGQETHASIQV